MGGGPMRSYRPQQEGLDHVAVTAAQLQGDFESGPAVSAEAGVLAAAWSIGGRAPAHAVAAPQLHLQRRDIRLQHHRLRIRRATSGIVAGVVEGSLPMRIERVQIAGSDRFPARQYSIAQAIIDDLY